LQKARVYDTETEVEMSNQYIAGEYHGEYKPVMVKITNRIGDFSETIETECLDLRGNKLFFTVEVGEDETHNEVLKCDVRDAWSGNAIAVVDIPIYKIDKALAESGYVCHYQRVRFECPDCGFGSISPTYVRWKQEDIGNCFKCGKTMVVIAKQSHNGEWVKV
jgi:hypothetical protein